MEHTKYKFKSEHLGQLLEDRLLEIAREKQREQGIAEGRLLTARHVSISVATAKLGELSPGLRARIEGEADLEHLEGLVVELASAPDPATVEEILGKL